MRILILALLSICIVTISCNKQGAFIYNYNKGLPLPSADTNHNFIITNYGARTNIADNATFIQKTINSCSAGGGGTVVIPQGNFLSGPITLKSNINLYFSKGSVLTALAYGAYPKSGDTVSVPSFITGTSIKNVKITGYGTIEGQGAPWWALIRQGSAIARPALVYFIKSKLIEVSGITLQNAPNVHLSIERGCDSTTINGITVNTPSTSPNTDGIDTWSPHINITNCNISDGDDNIAIDANSTNINVKGCTFGSGHGCSIGSFASNVTNVTVDSCTFSKTTNGIRIKSARGRGGLVSYIKYSNITMTGVANPIFLVSYYPSTPKTPAADSALPVTSSTPNYQHINFKNITITGSPNAGVIWGLPELSMSDIVFDNVNITATIGMKAYFLTGGLFQNGSTIKVSKGNAITTYNTTITGINLVTGLPQ